MSLKTIMSTIGFIVIAQTASVHCAAPAVSGFSVGALGYPHYFWGARNGMIWRHDIRNNVATRHVVLDSGRCSAPCISPDGAHVVYFKIDTAVFDTGNPYSSGYIWIMNSDGTNKRRLCATIKDVTDMLDFSGNNAIFSATGSTINRIDTVGTVVATYSVPTQPWQFEVANDLKKMMMRTSDFGGEDRGSIVAYDLSTWPTTTYRDFGGGAGSSPSCGSSLTCDGQYVCDGWTDHDGFDVRNWSNGSILKSVSNATVCSWAPNTKNFGTNPAHLFWSSCGATNSYKWRCISINGHQLLVNWVDNMCIVPTASFSVGFGWTENSFDAGDFWVGDLPPTSNDISQLQPKQDLGIKATLLPGTGIAIIISESEPYTVSLSDISGRTLWSTRNTHAKEYHISRAMTGSGVRIIKVQSAKNVSIKKMMMY